MNSDMSDMPTVAIEALPKNTNKFWLHELEEPKPYYIIVPGIRNTVHNMHNVDPSLFSRWLLSMAKQAGVYNKFILHTKVYHRNIYKRWDIIALLEDMCIQFSPVLFLPRTEIYASREDALQHMQGRQYVSLAVEEKET